MTQPSPLPVRVPLVTEPVGMLGSLQMARRNVLSIIPKIATTQPMVSGKTGKRWHMVMDPGAIREILLDRLEDKGWVERRPDPSDRRLKRVFLTGEVEELLRTMRALAGDMRAEALAGLDPAQQEQLLAYLAQVKENLSRMLDPKAQNEREAANG